MVKTVQDILALGGAEAPYEQVLEYIGGRMPGGPEGSEEENTWLRMRSWCAISRSWLLAFRQYNRESYE